jgi:hypothetical protein
MERLKLYVKKSNGSCANLVKMTKTLIVFIGTEELARTPKLIVSDAMAEGKLVELEGSV